MEQLKDLTPQVLEMSVLRSSKQLLKPAQPLPPRLGSQGCCASQGRLPGAHCPRETTGSAEEGTVSPRCMESPVLLPCGRPPRPSRAQGGVGSRPRLGALPRVPAQAEPPARPPAFPPTWPQAACLAGPPPRCHTALVGAAEAPCLRRAHFPTSRRGRGPRGRLQAGRQATADTQPGAGARLP